MNLFQGHIEEQITELGSKIPPKNNSIPIKPSEGSTMNNEDEEMQHQISKLQEKVHQSSLLQIATENEMDFLKKVVETKMDGFKKGTEANRNGLEANMDGMEVGMEAKMNDMEDKIDEKMENMKNDIKLNIKGLAKLIQEMFHNGKNIVEETHDENKINVNGDVINSNVNGWKNHDIPKLDMRNIDGKYPVTWIL